MIPALVAIELLNSIVHTKLELDPGKGYDLVPISHLESFVFVFKS
jgi:hypothetical protein